MKWKNHLKGIIIFGIGYIIFEGIRHVFDI